MRMSLLVPPRVRLPKPLFTPKQVDFLSKRVGNYQYSPSGLGMLIDQLWVR